MRNEICHVPREGGEVAASVAIHAEGVDCPHAVAPVKNVPQCDLLGGDCQFAQAVAEILQQAEMNDRFDRAQRSFQELGVRVRDGKAVWGS